MRTSPSTLNYLTASLSLTTPAARVRARVATAYRYVVRSSEAGGGVAVIKHRRGAGSSVGPGSVEGRRAFGSSSSGSSSASRSRSLAARARSTSPGRTSGGSSTVSFFDTAAASPPPRPRAFHLGPTARPSSPPIGPTDQLLPYTKPSAAPDSNFPLSPLVEAVVIAPPPTVDGLTVTSHPSTTSTSSSTTSPTLDKATFFSSGLSTPYPPHALPAFFGTTLSTVRRSNLIFRNGAYGIPKPSLVDSYKGKGKAQDEEESRETIEADHNLSVGIGEDAYFLRGDSLGVADGVGGWSGHAGANPARWSRKLMHHCSTELARYENVEDELFLQYYEVDPVDILQRAFERSLIECKEEGVIGSSTALLAILRNDELRLANMGDCCCSIIRGSDYIFRSEEQQHSFNFPVQAGTNSKDTPIKDAQRFNIKVQKDDIVILCSDGLVDNLFDEDILEEVLRFVASTPPPVASPSGSAPAGSRYTLNRFSPQAVSEALCWRAKSVYEDQRAVSSPFQQRAMEEGIHFAGGKRDDVTCVVASIGELEASPDRR